MSFISESSIEADYQRIRCKLFTLVSPVSWSIKPLKWCLTSAKTKYGMADSGGVIHINRQFLGSDYHVLFEAVLRHEFAHLCVGLIHGHNLRFKQCEQLFMAQFNKIAKQQAKDYMQHVNFKYLLQGELMDGQFVIMKKVHRKHRNYTHYRIGRRKIYYYKQQVIKKFHYIEIEKSELLLTL